MKFTNWMDKHNTVASYEISFVKGKCHMSEEQMLYGQQSAPKRMQAEQIFLLVKLFLKA